MLTRRRLLGSATAIAAAGTGGLAVAQGSWPTRPITLIVPSGAGGSTDFTARLIAQKLGADLGQSVVVENRLGANGGVGLSALAKAQPDGHVIGISTNTYLTFNPQIYTRLQYDSLKDFAPVALATYIPNVLVVNARVPANDIAALVRYLKAQSKPVSYASGGFGSSHHLAAELFKRRAGVEMLHVPYKGGAPAMVDLIGGQVEVAFPPLVEALAHLKDGKIRALGVTTQQRSPKVPDVPAIGEVIAGYELVLWNGIFAPAGTPAAVVRRLNEAVVAALRSDDVRAKLLDQGSSIAEPSGPEAFAAYLRAEMDRAGEIVARAGIRKGDADNQ